MTNKMSANDVRAILVDIVEKFNFPDPSFEILHIERIYYFELVNDELVRFTIDRHPHLFGKPTRGMPSSAFITIYKTYELNVKTKLVILIEETHDEPVINCSQLADEEFETYELEAEEIQQIIKIEYESDVEKWAKKRFNEFDWWQDKYPDDVITIRDYDPEIKMPPDFKNEIENALWEAFLKKVLKDWDSHYLDDFEDEQPDYSLREISEKHGIDIKVLRKHIKDGKLMAYKRGGSYFVVDMHLEIYLKEQD